MNSPPAVLAEIRPPRLSPRLRVLVKQVEALLPRDAERITMAIRGAVGEYDRAPDTAVPDDLLHSVVFNMQIWYDALLSGAPPSAETLTEAMASARRQVHQQVPLASVLRAYRIGSREFWQVLLDTARKHESLHNELLFRISPYLLYHFDLMAQTVSLSYATEQHRRVRWQDRLRHELCVILFNNPSNLEGFRSHAQSLGLDASLLHVALALRITGPTLASDLDDRLESLLASAVRALRVAREGVLHTVHNGHLLLWLPLPRGETPVSLEQSLAPQALSLFKLEPRVLALGVGLAASGPRGWQLSARQALRALETPAAGGPSVYRYSDIALDDLATGSEEVARYYDALIDRLSAESGLIETLQTYFDLGQHRKPVAAKLNIHPNTLDYRLHRIEALLGASLSDTSWLVKLHTALRLRQFRIAL